MEEKRKKMTAYIAVAIVTIILVFLAISYIRTTISSDNTINSVGETRTLNKVEMTIKQGTLTKTGATIVIEDKNEQPYTYENWFKIEKKEEGKWKEIPVINELYGFTEEGILVGEDGKLELQTDWSKLYGELEKGEYRIAKRQYENSYHYFYTEFSID